MAKGMSSMPSAFLKPTPDQAIAWYNWIATLDHKDGNPFDPKDKGKSLKKKQNDRQLCFLAAVVGTNGPVIEKKVISIDKDQSLYVGVSTELSTEMEYPNVVDLAKNAKEIIENEEINPQRIPDAYVELNGDRKTGEQLKDMIVTGSFKTITFKADNVFLIPPGSGKAAFYDYAVIVDRDALKKSTSHSLKYGHRGRSLNYDVEYEITIV